MSLSYELDVQGYGITFRVCHAFLKNAILLSISLVGYVIISAPLYLVNKSNGKKNISFSKITKIENAVNKSCTPNLLFSRENRFQED